MLTLSAPTIRNFTRPRDVSMGYVPQWWGFPPVLHTSQWDTACWSRSISSTVSTLWPCRGNGGMLGTCAFSSSGLNHLARLGSMNVPGGLPRRLPSDPPGRTMPGESWPFSKSGIQPWQKGMTVMYWWGWVWSPSLLWWEVLNTKLTKINWQHKTHKRHSITGRRGQALGSSLQVYFGQN